MHKVSNQTKIAHQSVQDIDYLLWALSTVRRCQIRHTLRNDGTLFDRRAFRLAMELNDVRGCDKLELLQIAMCCLRLGADVKLMAVPADDTHFASCMPLLEHAKLCARDQFIIDVQPHLSAWLKRVCAAEPHDALAWGCGTTQRTVRQVLQGYTSTVDSVARLLAAAHHKLHVWINHNGLDVGSTEFQRRFPYASRERYQSLCARKLRRRVSAKTFWPVLIGDMS